MTSHFRIKNFEQFQHYKDRSPPWIRLYNSLLDDYEFGLLPDASKAHLIAIWLLASRYDNRIPHDAEWVARRINATDPVNLEKLMAGGFIIVDQDCSEVLASCKQSSIPEESRAETEKRREEEKEDAAQPRENVSRETEAPRLVSTEEPDDLGDIQPVLDKSRDQAEVARIEAKLFAAAPAVKSRDTSPIFAYVDKGHDLETLILPVIRERGKPGVVSWSYFCPAIDAAIRGAEGIKPNGGTPAKPTMWLLAEDQRWLTAAERYRADKGKPPPKVAGMGGMGWHFPAEFVSEPSLPRPAA